MSCCGYNHVKIEDCPNCGAKESARMGSSKWGHDIMCCGDDCGFAVAKKIEENENNPEYQKALERLWKLKEEITDMRYDGINGVDHFFQL